MSKIKKMDKRGGVKLLSIWWFFVLAVIAGGVVIAVIIYYSADINSNKLESYILANKVMDCIINKGNLDIGLEEFDVFEKCDLEQEVFRKNSNFYFKIKIYEGDELVFSFDKGNSLFEKDCKIQEKILAKSFPKCSEKRASAAYGDKILEVVVLAGSNQQGMKE